jgi:competence protein ComEC
VRGSLRPLDPIVRGYYATQGIHLQLRATRTVELGRRGGLWGAVDAAHRYVLARLGATSAPLPTRALVAGIALGDTSGLPYAEREALRASGLYHIVAVSGQNVALLIAFTLVTLGIAGVIGTPARVTAAGVTAAYVLVSGAGPSIVRAGVAGVLVSAAWLASRPAPPWHLLACGAAVVLGFDPLELFDPGFQLSFAAVAAIHLVAPRLRGAVGEAAAISIACTVVTAPIAWWHFGRLTPLAVPANLLALPAVAPILWLATLAAAAGSVWGPLATPFLGVADLLSAYVLWVARSCS